MIINALIFHYPDPSLLSGFNIAISKFLLLIGLILNIKQIIKIVILCQDIVNLFYANLLLIFIINNKKYVKNLY
jgi:hypothetical protein